MSPCLKLLQCPQSYYYDGTSSFSQKKFINVFVNPASLESLQPATLLKNELLDRSFSRNCQFFRNAYL